VKVVMKAVYYDGQLVENDGAVYFPCPTFSCSVPGS